MSLGTLALLEALAAARSELLAAIDDVGQADSVPRPAGAVVSPDEPSTVRDILWRVGLFDDWTRLVLDQALDGRPTAAWNARARPAYLDTPELLRTWLDQTRAALLARARRLTDDVLDRELTLHGGARSSPRQLLERAVAHDRERAAQVRALRKGSH